MTLDLYRLRYIEKSKSFNNYNYKRKQKMKIKKNDKQFVLDIKKAIQEAPIVDQAELLKSEGANTNGTTVSAVQDIASKLEMELIENYRNDELSYLARIGKRSLAGKQLNAILTKALTNPNKEFPISGGLREKAKPSIITLGFTLKQTVLAIYGLGWHVSDDSTYETTTDVYSLSEAKAIEQRLFQKNRSVLLQNNAKIGKGVITSATAGTGGSLAAKTYSVVVVPLSSNAASFFRAGTRINSAFKIMSKVQIPTETDKVELQNFGLGLKSDAVEVAVEANGKIVVVVPNKFGVYANAVFVDGKLQAIVSRNKFEITKVATDTQALSEILNEDCSDEPNVGAGVLQIASSSDYADNTIFLGDDEELTVTEFGSIEQIDEVLYKLEEKTGVRKATIYVSTDVNKDMRAKRFAGFSTNISFNAGNGTVEALNVSNKYPHPNDDSLKLEVLVLPHMPAGTIQIVGELPAGQYGEVTAAIEILQNIEPEIQVYARVDRSIQGGVVERYAVTVPAPDLVYHIRNCSRKEVI